MVKKLSKFLAYTLFFVLALMFFAPKISAYYLLEQQIKPFGVIISTEDLRDNGFSLDVESAEVSFKGIESANIEKINIKIFGIYNAIDVQNIELSSTAATFIPLHVNSAKLSYSILDPLHAHGYIEGEFGEANLAYDLLENSVHIVLQPSSLMLKNYKNTLRSLKKDENGEYVYDKAF